MEIAAPLSDVGSAACGLGRAVEIALHHARAAQHEIGNALFALFVLAHEFERALRQRHRMSNLASLGGGVRDRKSVV